LAQRLSVGVKYMGKGACVEIGFVGFVAVMLWVVPANSQSLLSRVSGNTSSVITSKAANGYQCKSGQRK
jgi:hypothetical protein